MIKLVVVKNLESANDAFSLSMKWINRIVSPSRYIDIIPANLKFGFSETCIFQIINHPHYNFDLPRYDMKTTINFHG